MKTNPFNILTKKRGQHRPITTIEIDQGLLKLVQIKYAAVEKHLTNILTWPFNSNLKAREIGANFLNFLKTKNINIDYLRVCLASQLVTTRYLKVPSTNPAEVDKMVRLQIPKLLPYPPEQIISSHKIIRSEKDGYSYILVVLVHRDVVDRQLEILKAASLTPEFLALSSEGNLELYLNSLNRKAEKDVLIIDIDSKYADIEIVSQDKLVLTRAISIDTQFKQPEADWQTKLITQIQRSQDIYRKEVGKLNIGKVFIMGSSEHIHNLDEVMAKELSLPVEIVEPGKQIRALILDSGVHFESGQSFSSVIGLSLGRDLGNKINLLPAEFKLKKKVFTRRKAILNLCTKLVLLLVAFFLISAKDIIEKRRNINAIKRTMIRINPQSQRLGLMLDRLKVIRAQRPAENSCVNIIHELYKIIPEDVLLNMLIFQRNHFVSLKGQAKDLSTVINLVTLLEKSDYFENVQQRFAAKRKFQNREVTDFEIICPLSFREEY